MAKVYIKNLGEDESYNGTLRELAKCDSVGIHRIAESAENADVILLIKFTGGGPFADILRHPLYLKFKDKCRVFCSGDKPLTFLPGVYTSLSKRQWDPNWAISFHYLHGPQNPFLCDDRIQESPSVTYSFLGNSATHKIRVKLFDALIPNRFVFDTGSVREQIQSISDPAERKAARFEFRRAYADSLYGAKFILCPRGFGTATFRIFEAMRCGRVPVIISDDWVEPAGPNWPSCSIRVPERGISDVENILSERLTQADQMGRVAKLEWERCFSPQVSFHRLVEAASSICPPKSRANRVFQNLLCNLAPEYLKLFSKETFAKPR